MNRILTLACTATLLLSFNLHAGFLDTLKEVATDVAVEVKKDVQYSVDQTLRNTFPAAITAGKTEDAPEGYKDEVIIFGFDSCPYCVKAEKFFRSNRIHYKDMNVEKSRSAKKEFRKLGGGGVPLLIIGDKKIRGFSEDKITALLKEEGFI